MVQVGLGRLSSASGAHSLQDGSEQATEENVTLHGHFVVCSSGTAASTVSQLFSFTDYRCGGCDYLLPVVTAQELAPV